MSPSKLGPKSAKAKAKPKAKPKAAAKHASVEPEAATPAVTTVRVIQAAGRVGPDLDLTEAEQVRSERVKALAADIERALASGELRPVISPDAVQAMLAAMCRIYTAHSENHLDYDAFSGARPLTPTDVMITSSALLKAANLAVFELGMWQTWTGR